MAEIFNKWLKLILQMHIISIPFLFWSECYLFSFGGEKDKIITSKNTPWTILIRKMYSEFSTYCIDLIVKIINQNLCLTRVPYF